jgi:hypothetical protein
LDGLVAKVRGLEVKKEETNLGRAGLLAY